MIPNNQLGNIDRKSSWLDTVRTGNPLIDFEVGGVALYDSSEGLRVQTWRSAYEDGSVVCYDGDENRYVLFSRPGVVALGLAFDQLMAPFVAFQDAGGVAYWWFNPATSVMEFSPYLPGSTSAPRCTLDDTRELASGWSDIILAYMRGRDLCYRQQRDNYAIERVLEEDAGSSLMAIGMAKNLSLQFRLRP